MKKILYIFIAFTLFFTAHAFAQRDAACDYIDPTSPSYHDLGCDDVTGSGNGGTVIVTPPHTPVGPYDPNCANIPKTNPDGSTNPDWVTRGCGLGGGTPATGTVNTGTGTSGTVAVASSAQLQACSAIKFKSALDILIWVKCIILAAIIPLIFALAFVFFLWGVFKYMTATDQKTREESRKFIIYGIIGLFVMVGVWGIIKILSTTLGVDSSTVPILQTEYLDTSKASK